MASYAQHDKAAPVEPADLVLASVTFLGLLRAAELEESSELLMVWVKQSWFNL
jgi:hypothetical protein